MVSRLQNTSYKNWIKCTLGLQIAAETVRPYVAKEFEDFYDKNDILSVKECLNYDGKWYCLPDCPCDRHVYHVLCHPVRWDNQQEEHYMETDCNRCTEAFSLIYNLLREEHWKKRLRWDNIEFTRIYDDPWAIAQVFMPIGGQMCDTPARTDPLALFRVMLNCSLFNASNDGSLSKYLEQLCHHRNELMHSSSNLVSSEDTSAIFKLLDYVLTIKNDDSWMKARSELNELQHKQMTIDMFNKATSYKIQALQTDIAALESTASDGETKEDSKGLNVENLRNSLQSCCYDKSDEQDKTSFREQSAEIFKQMSQNISELNKMKNSISLTLQMHESKQKELRKDMDTALEKLRGENRRLRCYKYILICLTVMVVLFKII